MSTITKPMALDESFKTTETTPRNIADVLAEMGEAIAQGMGRQANEVAYNNTTSGLSADDVQEAIDELAEEKVDKVTGKGLSTNDYTDAEKTKLAGIAAGAEVNVQSDWAQSDDEEDDFIKNKPQVDVESISDTTPYLYRKSPAIGTRVMENALVGASVVKNQLVGNGNFADTSVWNVFNGTLTVSGNIGTFSSSSSENKRLSTNSIAFLANHKYLISFEYKSDNAFSFQKANNNISLPSASSFTRVTMIDTRGSVSDRNLIFYDYSESASWELQLKNVICVDLTQEFGSSTIPNTAYTKETVQAGSGIAWLKDNGFDFSKYIAYNTGTLESVEATGKEVVGFNQWDEEWEVGTIATSNGQNATDSTRIRSKGFIRVLPSTEYYMKCSANDGRGLYYDENMVYIGNDSAMFTLKTFTTPYNCHYIRFSPVSSYGTTYNHDICINISKTTGTPKNGDYVPYEKHTYAYPETTLRGLFELVNDRIVAKGDRLGSDGKCEVKFEAITFDGSNDETWSTSESWPVGCWYSPNALVNGVSVSGYSIRANIISDGGATFAPQSLADGSRFGVGQGNGTSFYLRVDNTLDTEAKLRTYLSNNPITVYYELATPTTESLPPFDNPQISIVNGTEEFITNTDVPVGHESEYKALPDMFDDDYIQYLQTQAENATQNVSVAPPTLHAYDSTTHKMGTNGVTPSSWNVEDMPSEMKDFYQKFETAINDHGNQIANIPADWTFIQSVTSTSGESVTIPNTATYIMVLLFGSYSPDPLLPATTAVCNSLETLYATISMSHYDVELHGTYNNVDHYVKYDDESHKWSVSDANTSASIFYR